MRPLTSLQIMMSYLYCGGTESLKTNVSDLLEVRITIDTDKLITRWNSSHLLLSLPDYIMSRYVVSSTLSTSLSALMCLHVWTNEPVSKIILTNKRWEPITETSSTCIQIFCLFFSCSCCQLPVCSSWGRYKDTVNSSALTTSTWIMQSASIRQPR